MGVHTSLNVPNHVSLLHRTTARASYTNINPKQVQFQVKSYLVYTAHQ